MQEILLSKGVPDKDATLMLNVFHEQLSYAQHHYLTPAPTFRHVIDAAENLLKAQATFTEALVKEKLADKLCALHGFFKPANESFLAVEEHFRKIERLR
jgi:hypothetical protein